MIDTGQIFKLNETFEIVCDSEGTRYGFRHLAHLYRNGNELGVNAKACYYNRTWEKFTFETVIHLLLEKAVKADVFTEAEVTQFRTEINSKYGY